MLAGQSSILAFVQQLKDKGFWSRIEQDNESRITAVIFAHPSSLAYLQLYPHLLLIDCTYKTNKHELPLFDLVGVDASQRTFCVAFAFLSGETEEDFTWALNNLKELYFELNIQLPSIILTDQCRACINSIDNLFPLAIGLLCLWHANKAVLAHCKPSIIQKNGAEAWDWFFKQWHTLIRSPTKDIYYQRLRDLEQTEYIDEVTYLKSTWLVYKERLVKAWVD